MRSLVSNSIYAKKDRNGPPSTNQDASRDHPYLVSMLFADLLSLHLVTLLMFFILVHVTFFSSRCMLELKFVICYRATCPPSQASYAVLAGE